MSNIRICEYVIGVVHDNDTWFYAGDKDEEGAVISSRERFSSALDDVRRYNDINILHDDLENLSGAGTYKIIEIRKCPKCKKDFVGYPAISREDNETEICPRCGLIEAINRYTSNADEVRAI